MNDLRQMDESPQSSQEFVNEVMLGEWDRLKLESPLLSSYPKCQYSEAFDTFVSAIFIYFKVNTQKLASGKKARNYSINLHEWKVNEKSYMNEWVGCNLFFANDKCTEIVRVLINFHSWLLPKSFVEWWYTPLKIFKVMLLICFMVRISTSLLVLWSWWRIWECWWCFNNIWWFTEGIIERRWLFSYLISYLIL